MTTKPTYLHLRPEQALPRIPCLAPFRALIVLDAPCTKEWRELVSQWLVDWGCLYAMTWGENSTEWDTSIDIANIEKFDFEEVPEDDFVMTTLHDDEPLSETMWFAKNNAYHPTVQLRDTLILHIASFPSEVRLLSAYTEA